MRRRAVFFFFSTMRRRTTRTTRFFCNAAGDGHGDGDGRSISSNSSSSSSRSAGGSLHGVILAETQFAEWGRHRRNRLTASVFGFALGFWKGRRVQLWEEKVGLREPFGGNVATQWDDANEERALSRYQELTGNTVRHILFKSHPFRTSVPDWMGASPDGLIRDVRALDGGGLLEVKCPFRHSVPLKACVPWDSVPYYYIPQAQGLLEIFDREWMDFYVWTMNGSCVYRIERDADLWELMLTALNDFWWVHVTPAKHLLSRDPKSNVKRYKPSPQHALYLPILSRCRRMSERCPVVFNELQRNPLWHR